MPPTSSLSNDTNTFMPLLFAAHPEIVPNYRRMAAMDDQRRTASALEHKFRAWRQEGRKILAEKGGDTGAVISTPKKATATHNKKNSLEGVADKENTPAKTNLSLTENDKNVANENDEDAESDDDIAAVSQSKAEMHASKKPTTPTNKKRAAMTPVPITDSKKRAASTTPAWASASDKGNSSPIKKARVSKKGTAQKVKKGAPKPRESEEEVSSSEEEQAEEAKKSLGKGPRGRDNVMSKSKVSKAGEAAKQALGVKVEDTEKEEGEEKVEMVFD